MTTEREHRTLEQWTAILIERNSMPVPEPKGWYGSVKVNVYGVKWQAPSVAELEAEGYEVHINHVHKYRQPVVANAPRWLRNLLDGKMPDPRGGRTFVTLLHRDGTWARGMVKCWSKDIYSKRIGYTLAVNRALDKLNGK